MSNGLLPTWAEPARNRVLLALAEYGGALSIRELARLAGVAPSTALRIADELARARVLTRHRVGGARIVQVDPSRRAELRRTYSPRPRSKGEQLEYLRSLNIDLWVIDPTEVASYGVRRRVNTFVITVARWRHLKVTVPMVVFNQARPLQLHRAQLPAIELLVALLKLDVIAARQLYVRLTLDTAQRRKLLRRIRQERLAAAAERARIPLDARRGPRTP